MAGKSNRLSSCLIDQKKYEGARTTLEQADKEMAPNLMRRKCAIFILQARVYLKQREYEGAALMANSTLGLASTIAFPSMSQVAAIHGELSTRWKASDEVMELGDALTTAVGGKRLVLPSTI